MDDTRATAALAAMAVIVGVALPAVTVIDTQARGPTGATVGPFGSAHDHLSLFFLTGGEEKVMTEPYILRDRKVHFHASDGILHVEATGITLGYALDALNISLTPSCVTFGPDNASYCVSDTSALRVMVNGEEMPVKEAKGRRLEQDDALVIYHGPRNATVPEEYTERTLPDRYRPGVQGTPV